MHLPKGGMRVAAIREAAAANVALISVIHTYN